MPKPNARAIELLWADGFIPIAVAEQSSGISRTTLYDWIKERKVAGCRNGMFHYVLLSDLRQLCPQIDPAAVRTLLEASY